jgi:hypothetical protein
VKAIGICYTRGTAEPGRRPDLLYSRDELKEKGRTLIGKPIWVEHDRPVASEAERHALAAEEPDPVKAAALKMMAPQQIGKITGSGVDGQGQMVVQFEVDRSSSVLANKIIDEMRRGGMSLSLGQRFQMDPETKEVVSKEITEVSVVRYPAMPGTDIIWVEDDPVVDRHAEIESLKKHLEETPEPVPAAADPPPPTAAAAVVDDDAALESTTAAKRIRVSSSLDDQPPVVVASDPVEPVVPLAAAAARADDGPAPIDSMVVADAVAVAIVEAQKTETNPKLNSEDCMCTTQNVEDIIPQKTEPRPEITLMAVASASIPVAAESAAAAAAPTPMDVTPVAPIPTGSTAAAVAAPLFTLEDVQRMKAENERLRADAEALNAEKQQRDEKDQASKREKVAAELPHVVAWLQAQEGQSPEMIELLKSMSARDASAAAPVVQMVAVAKGNTDRSLMAMNEKVLSAQQEVARLREENARMQADSAARARQAEYRQAAATGGSVTRAAPESDAWRGIAMLSGAGAGNSYRPAAAAAAAAPAPTYQAAAPMSESSQEFGGGYLQTLAPPPPAYFQHFEAVASAGRRGVGPVQTPQSLASGMITGTVRETSAAPPFELPRRSQLVPPNPAAAHLIASMNHWVAQTPLSDGMHRISGMTGRDFGKPISGVAPLDGGGFYIDGSRVVSTGPGRG